MILGVHPFGSTELYDDGQLFLDHIGPFWIAIHLLAVPMLIGFSIVLWRWVQGLSNPMAAVLGAWSAMIAIGGMAVGSIHLIATDTTTFVAYRATFDAADGSEVALLGADLLLRIHAATLVAWILSFWFMVPAVLTAVLWLEKGRPWWMTAATGAAALCQVISLVLFFQAGQHTTIGETGVFRVGVTLLVAVVGVLAWELRRGAPIGTPAQ